MPKKKRPEDLVDNRWTIRNVTPEARERISRLQKVTRKPTGMLITEAINDFYTGWLNSVEEKAVTKPITEKPKPKPEVEPENETPEELSTVTPPEPAWLARVRRMFNGRVR